MSTFTEVCTIECQDGVRRDELQIIVESILGSRTITFLKRLKKSTKLVMKTATESAERGGGQPELCHSLVAVLCTGN
jgi:hypothetical protein